MSDPHCYKCGRSISLDDTDCAHCQTPLLLYGKYPVLGILRPENDNGIVYRARHDSLDAELVIKLAPSWLAKHIQNEARILQSLRRRLNFTPHVYDFYTQHDYTALVMDWIDGQTLEQVHPQELWPVAEVEHFLDELLQHLEELHHAGIIHRDLKPQNIIKRPDGSYALIDFNIAKRTGEETEFSGFSRRYAPPEQLPESHPHAPLTDERSDLYSLAATAYDLLTGQSLDPKNPHPRLPNLLKTEAVPAAMERTLRQMLSAEMSHRPATATEARRLLKAPVEVESSDAQEGVRARGSASDDTRPPEAPEPTQMGTELSLQPSALKAQTFPSDDGQGRITGIAWAPSGVELAIATARGIRIYTVASGAERLFRPTRSPVQHIGYTLDGRALAFALGEKIEVRRVDTGEPIQVLPGYAEDTPGAVVFASAGRALAVATHETLSVLDIEQNVVLDKRSKVMNPRLLVSSQNGQILATSPGDSATLWHMDNNALASIALPGDIPAPVVSMAITPDGRTLAIASHTTVKLWKTEQPQKEPAIRHSRGVRHIALSPDGQRLAVVTETGIQIVSIATDRPIRNIALADLAADIFQIAFDKQGVLLAAAAPGLVGIWDSATGRELTRREYTDNPRAVAFTSDGSLLVSAGQRIQLWNIAAGAGTRASQISHSSGKIRDVLFAQDEKTLTLAAASSNSIMVWKHRAADNGNATPNAMPASSLGGTSPDGSRWQRLGAYASAHVQSHGLAFTRRGRGGALQVVNVAREGINIRPAAGLNSGKYETSLLSGAYDIAFALSGWVAAASTDRVVRVWRIGDQDEPHELRLNFAPNSIALAPDGRTLAAVADDAIQIWHVSDEAPIDTRHGPEHGAERIVFAPDGTTLATIRQNEISIWRLDAGHLTPVCQAHDHTDRVTDVAFSTDWRTFASTSEDGTIRLWRYMGLSEGVFVSNGDHKVPLAPPKPPFVAPPAPQLRLRIFLCHVIEDQERVQLLHQQLQELQFDIWEFRQLTPGEKWRDSIRKNIQKADIFIACLSHNFLNKQSYAQHEIEYALQIAEKLPTEQIYIIPLRLDACKVPDQLSVWQWFDYFDGSEPKQLIQALRKRAEQVAFENDQQPRVDPGLSSRQTQAGRSDSHATESHRLRALLAAHRSYLGVLRVQVATLGEVFAPPAKLLEITALEDKIRNIKAKMRDLGIPYINEYGDSSNSSDMWTVNEDPG